MSPNIFISYASEDRQHVQRLRALLHAVVGDGATFVEPERVRSGTTWTLELARAIVDSTHFVVVWSSRARDSHWVHQEVSSAVELSREQPLRRIIPVRIDPTPLPEELQPFQRIDLFGPHGEKASPWSLRTLLELAASVAFILGLAATIHAVHRVAFGLLALWVALAAFVALRFEPRCDANRDAHVLCRLIRALDLTPRALKVLFVGGCACGALALAKML